MKIQKITTHLWFDSNAEEAVDFYVSVFKNAAKKKTAYYGKEGTEIHGRPPGSVMTVEFELEGQSFLALNGGPHFKFNEAISLVISCKDQAEIDHYWNKLTEGGDAQAQMCGWLKDKFGLSWQVVPDNIGELMTDPTKSDKVMKEVLQMKKIDMNKLEAIG